VNSYNGLLSGTFCTEVTGTPSGRSDGTGFGLGMEPPGAGAQDRGRLLSNDDHSGHIVARTLHLHLFDIVPADPLVRENRTQRN